MGNKNIDYGIITAQASRLFTRLTHGNTGKSISIKTADGLFDSVLLEYLDQRAHGSDVKVQDGVPHLSAFERDFILMGLDRFEWEHMHYDVEAKACDGNGNASPVRFIPIKSGYRCDTVGKEPTTLCFLVKVAATAGGKEAWCLRCNDWATIIEEPQLEAITAKVNQLNLQA